MRIRNSQLTSPQSGSSAFEDGISLFYSLGMSGAGALEVSGNVLQHNAARPERGDPDSNGSIGFVILP